MDMMIVLDLFLISCISVFIIDVSGFISTLKHFIVKKLLKMHKYTEISLKPFDCSLCISWWACFVYLIVSHQLTIPLITVALFISCLTPVWKDLFYLVQDILQWLINQISKITRL